MHIPGLYYIKFLHNSLKKKLHSGMKVSLQVSPKPVLFPHSQWGKFAYLCNSFRLTASNAHDGGKNMFFWQRWVKCTPEQLNNLILGSASSLYLSICLVGVCTCCCYSLTWFVGITDFASVYFLTSSLELVPCNALKSHTAALEAF